MTNDNQTLLPPEWQKQLSDPYAVLGISVTATEHQILKRYHSLAKQLHSESFLRSHEADKELATSVFTYLIEPAYKLLKHPNSRNEMIAKLRLDAIFLQLLKDASLQTALAQELIQMPASEVDIFYEPAIASLAEAQYKSLVASYQITQQLSELNLVYFCLLSPNALVQENPTVVTDFNTESVELTLSEVKPVVNNYAERHYQRGIHYVKQANWRSAVQELRDAIKLEPNNSDYLALLGFVHLKQNLTGMAKVYLRQALRLNPKHPLALKYASRVSKC
jgi:curved DNA-binding protein CbpA